MKLCRCPVCHSDLHLDAILEDDAGRQMLSLILPLPGGCAKHLVAYVGLFRPEKSNLSNARALKLAQEVLDLYPAGRVLSHALSETVERIRAKRASGDKKPLSNHAYLATVYSTSAEVFAKTSNVDARAKDLPKPGRDTDDAYFRQMQSFGRDVSTLKGGAEWLAKQGGNNER